MEREKVSQQWATEVPEQQARGAPEWQAGEVPEQRVRGAPEQQVEERPTAETARPPPQYTGVDPKAVARSFGGHRRFKKLY